MRTPALLLLVGIVLTGCTPERPGSKPQHPDPTSRRTLGSGDVVGFTGQYDSHVWLGIPFASPPVGEHRWRAPEPPDAWEGVRDAVRPGSACPQFPSPFGVETEGDDPVGDEDCLYLNVYAPRFAPGDVPNGPDRLPVMLWIHGGGNVIGQASVYDGGRLAAAHDVVVVMTNYRLGPLGWFRHEALRASAQNDEDASGNFGTLDLVRALDWIRENAPAFGGDPDNVTIFGESAGGRNVVSLLVSAKARGLFHRAIVQSGGTGTILPERAENLVDAELPGHRNSSNEILLRLLVDDGEAETRLEARKRLLDMSDDAIGDYLRRKTPAELLLAYQTEEQEALIDVPQLFRDGAVLPTTGALETIRKNRHNAVPVILGTNRDENKLFLALNPDFVWRIFGVFPWVYDWKHYDTTAEHLSNLWKATGADEPGALLHDVQEAGVWVYRFDWDEEPATFLLDVSRLLGAAHAFEIPFVFGHWDLGSQTDVFFTGENRPGREELSRKMMSYWAEFARRGDPGRGRESDLPRWEDFAPVGDGRRFIVFDTETDAGVRMTEGFTAVDDVVGAVEADPRLPTWEERCDVYRRLVEWGRGIARSDYPDLGDGACASFPLTEPTAP